MAVSVSRFICRDLDSVGRPCRNGDGTIADAYDQLPPPHRGDAIPAPASNFHTGFPVLTDNAYNRRHYRRTRSPTTTGRRSAIIC